MGALAPVSPWLPEDDLLLKNSIEAGASLESLAKGAVQFSRKVTVQELQDRWHSLLYDPVVSAEASFCMIEYECSALTLPSKLNRVGNSKENRCFSGKRKSESVHSCYHALRKRIRNEPFNPMDLSFLVAPGDDNFFGNEDEPQSGNCMLGDPMSNPYGLQESNLDIMHHSFPEVPVDNIHEKITHIFEENQSFTGNGSGIEELGRPEQVPDLFEENTLKANPAYGQINSDLGNVCSEFEGNQVFHSAILESDASFQNLDYSSPLPEMPIWSTVEDVSTPAILVDSLGEKDLHRGDTFTLPDDGGAKETSAPGCDFVQASSELKVQMSCDMLKSPAASTENYLAELSNSLLNFTNDEEILLMDADGKEMIDKSYYDGLSLLLSSPNEVNQDQMPSPKPETSQNPTHASGLDPAESVEKVQIQSSASASASASDSQFSELNHGIICCTLNTEDPDVPCNDDVFLPNNFQTFSTSIAIQRNFKEVGPSSVEDFLGNQKSNEGDLVWMQRGQENRGQSHALSQTMGSQVIPEKGQPHPLLDCGAKFELPNCDSPQVASRTPAIASVGSIQVNLVNISTDNARLKEENKEIALVKDLGHPLTYSLLEKPAFGSDGYKTHERDASDIKKEFDALATIQDRQASNMEVGSINFPDSEPVTTPPTSEPEELYVDSDDDGVPYFSDIEAMILDMDLDPDDQDVYEQEVSKYQNEESMRAIIRLEQGAYSFMQTAVASHGAFAILYGRHSKHYIKKPEVLLGRATEDVFVDIDLGREGCANKISRRQAMIKMDKGGSFHMKNLGKFSISVNNKEVNPGQSLSLNSSCLIEIRGMPFIFEISQKCVKQYLDNITKEKPNS